MPDTSNNITRRSVTFLDALQASIFFGIITGLTDAGTVLSAGVGVGGSISEIFHFLNASALLTTLVFLPLLIITWLILLTLQKSTRLTYPTCLTVLYFIATIITAGLLAAGPVKETDAGITIGNLRFLWLAIPTGWAVSIWLSRMKTDWAGSKFYTRLSAFCVSLGIYITAASLSQNDLLAASSTSFEKIIVVLIPFIPSLISLFLLSTLFTLAAKIRKFPLLAIILLIVFVFPFMPSLLGGPSTVGTTPSGETHTAGGKNVLLISIDTLRKDDLGVYGSELVETPNIDLLAESSMVFDNAVTPIPMTGPSHMTMLTGLQPDPSYGHGVLNNGIVLPDTFPTLATILDNLGYKTGATIGGSPLTREASGLHRGFHYYNDVFEDSFKSRLFPGHTWSLTVSRIARKLFSMSGVGHGWLKKDAETVTGEAIDFIDSTGDDNFFLFVHYYDPHTPLNPPSPYDEMYDSDLESQEIPFKDEHPYKNSDALNKFSDEILAERRAIYRGEITYTDYWLGQLFEHLKSTEKYDNTMIIVTADHGEAFENAYIGHLNRLWESCVNVPLIVKNPDKVHNLNRKYTTLVNTSDIFYTILNFLDVPDSDELASAFHSSVPGSIERWNHNLSGIFMGYTSSISFTRTWDYIPMLTNGIPTSNETFVGPTYAFRREQYKLIFTPEENVLLPEFQFFDLISDPPGEIENRLPGIVPEDVMHIPNVEILLENWADTTRASGSGSMDPLIRAQLEALGYAQRNN